MICYHWYPQNNIEFPISIKRQLQVYLKSSIINFAARKTAFSQFNYIGKKKYYIIYDYTIIDFPKH